MTLFFFQYTLSVIKRRKNIFFQVLRDGFKEIEKSNFIHLFKTNKNTRSVVLRVTIQCSKRTSTNTPCQVSDGTETVKSKVNKFRVFVLLQGPRFSVLPSMVGSFHVQ